MKKDLPKHCINLKNFRKEQGLTQQQLADIIGTSVSNIKSLETDVVKPSYKFLIKSFSNSWSFQHLNINITRF